MAIDIPIGFISVKASSDLPPLNTSVSCFMSNGKIWKGHRYDNTNRSGWMTRAENDGFYANHIWSGIEVIAWKHFDN